MARKSAPYIVVRADAPLDARWTADLWFAWSRVLATCRIKRACTAETWPAAVLRLRTIEAASILAVHPNKVRWMLDRLVIPASMTARCERDHGGDLWTITVAKYAEYQKIGRPTLHLSYAYVGEPPYDPTTLRPYEEEEQSPGASAPERVPVPVDGPPPEGDAVAQMRPPRANRKALPSPPPEWALAAAKDLAVATRRRWPGALIPESFVGWARKIAGIKQPQAEVLALLRWYVDPARDGPGGGIAPYTPEVRSGATFAEKWNQIMAARQRDGREVRRMTPGERILARTRRQVQEILS